MIEGLVHIPGFFIFGLVVLAVAAVQLASRKAAARRIALAMTDAGRFGRLTDVSFWVALSWVSAVPIAAFGFYFLALSVA